MVTPRGDKEARGPRRRFLEDLARRSRGLVLGKPAVAPARTAIVFARTAGAANGEAYRLDSFGDRRIRIEASSDAGLLYRSGDRFGS